MAIVQDLSGNNPRNMIAGRDLSYVHHDERIITMDMFGGRPNDVAYKDINVVAFNKMVDYAYRKQFVCRPGPGVWWFGGQIRTKGSVIIEGAGRGYNQGAVGDPTAVGFIGTTAISGTCFAVAPGAATLNGWTDPKRHSLLVVDYDQPPGLAVAPRRFCNISDILFYGNLENNINAADSYSGILVPAWNTIIRHCGVIQFPGHQIALLSANSGSAFDMGISNSFANNSYLEDNWCIGDYSQASITRCLSGIFNEARDSKMYGNTTACCAVGLDMPDGVVRVDSHYAWRNLIACKVSALGKDITFSNPQFTDNEREGLVIQTVGSDEPRRVSIIGGSISSNGNARVGGAITDAQKSGINIIGGSTISGLMFDGVQITYNNGYAINADTAALQIFVGLINPTGNTLGTYNVPAGTQIQAHAAANTGDLIHPAIKMTGDINLNGSQLKYDGVGVSIDTDGFHYLRGYNIAALPAANTVARRWLWLLDTVGRPYPAISNGSGFLQAELTPIVNVVKRVDTSHTIIWGTDAVQQIYDAPITANRTITLSSTGAGSHSRFRITRTANATGAFSVVVTATPSRNLAISQWCDVVWDGAAWIIVASGVV